jgi:hypothetical protein
MPSAAAQTFEPHEGDVSKHGTSTDMFGFNGATEAEWVGGISGTVQTQAIPLGASSVWRTPDGHIFAAGNGLIVH